jgi:cyanophycin synthetase
VCFDRGDAAPALAFLARSGTACFVKPVNGAGGAGATGGVWSPQQLRRAVLRAGRRFDRLVIERQLPGDVYRLLFLDGELLDVIRRRPAHVTGDGRSTIRELSAAAHDRGASPWLLAIDLDCVFALERSGWRLDAVPPPGRRVVVKTAVNANGPEDNESVFGEVAADLVAQARRAASIVGVRLAGVDVVTPDPARALEAAGGAVLEVNATPGLGYHDAIRNPGRVEPVATQVLRRLLEGPGAAPRDRHATTERRENSDGRQAQVRGDAPRSGVPDQDHVGPA